MVRDEETVFNKPILCYLEVTEGDAMSSDNDFNYKSTVFADS